MAYERKAGNWITSFLYFTSESESPDSYFVWTALSTIAAVVQRKIKNKWIYSDVYPNLYITLVGPPGKVHKSSVLNFSRAMLYELEAKFDTRIAVTSESISREAMIDQMQTGSFKLEDDTPISATTIISGELMTFFASSAEKMVEFLTDIYDSPNVFKHTTRGSGTAILRNAYVNFIAATTPSWIASYFDIAFIDQGFASRTLFVYETKPRFLNPEPNITPEMWEMKDKLLEDLNHIASLSGEFVPTEAAREWFKDWYLNTWPNEKLDYRLSSYHSRKPLMMRKLAMLLSLAECDDLEITVDYYLMAEGLLKSIEPSMSRTFSAVGKNKYASDLERIFNDIVLSDGISAELLRRQNYSALDRAAFEDNINNLVAMGAIKREVTPQGVMYIPLLDDLS